FGIIEGGSASGGGWTSPLILGCFAVSACALVSLVLYERRREEPLIDLRFFHSVPFTGATFTAVTAFSALAGFLFLNTPAWERGMPETAELVMGALTRPKPMPKSTYEANSSGSEPSASNPANSTPLATIATPASTSG
ncbi:hypothetical protein KDA82_28125, partial [Streptomyces daliensis]|nr:hypothetical protein [Streptomyces daliensis]